MDNDTRFAFASLYRQIGQIAAQAAEAHATAMALQNALTEASPAIAESFEKHNHSEQVTEIRLQAAHMQVSIRQVIERFEKLNT
jgi:hypothetical protein